MKKLLYLSFLLALFQSNSQAQKSVLLINGTAHIGNGQVINNSLIGIKNGKIILVADALLTTPKTNEFDTTINIEGQHVYPGFIASDVAIGLIEIEAVRSTADFNETGMFNPNVRTLIAYNTDSKVIPTVRSNGVLIAQVTPRGGIVSGTSSVMRMNGWNWEDAAQKADEGLHLNWPNNFQRTGWWAEPGETTKSDKYNESIVMIRKFFTEAKAYADDKDPKKKDARFEAMRGLFDGTKTMYIHSHYAKEITDAVLFCREMKIAKIVLVGGYDSWMLTDLLKENKVSVILRRIHELPVRAEDDVDLPFKIPALLQKAGVNFCLGNSGDQEAAQCRNIPFLAGQTVAYGLTKEEALASITLNAAKILGIDAQCGSLEPGKDATLFISKGDALDMRTNKVLHAWIKGEKINLYNHQEELSDKYKKKYGMK